MVQRGTIDGWRTFGGNPRVHGFWNAIPMACYSRPFGMTRKCNNGRRLYFIPEV